MFEKCLTHSEVTPFQIFSQTISNRYIIVYCRFLEAQGHKTSRIWVINKNHFPRKIWRRCKLAFPLTNIYLKFKCIILLIY